jgi:prepilin-type N-terminal cleavage/methylation domain-containing protein
MKRSAFTMMELMIAMGILAVGMAMSASLFPTAAKEANTAIGSAVGQTIAENGLAMGKLAFRSSEHLDDGRVKNLVFTTPALATVLDDADLIPDRDGGRVDELGSRDTNILTLAQTQYPMESGGKYGFALLARKVDEDANAYQIVATAYLKKEEDNLADWDYIKISGGGASKEVTIQTGYGSYGEGSQAYVNSPLILYKSGRIATVIAQAGTKLTLDREIEVDDAYAIVLRERIGTSGNYETRSPAIYTMTITTSLDE